MNLKIVLSKYNFKNLEHKRFNIELVPVAKIEDVFRKLFG